jgi:hypothetical protein
LRANCYHENPSLPVGFSWRHDIKLDRLIVVYPRERRYSLGDQFEVVPLAQLVEPSGTTSPFKKRRG